MLAIMLLNSFLPTRERGAPMSTNSSISYVVKKGHLSSYATQYACHYLKWICHMYGDRVLCTRVQGTTTEICEIFCKQSIH